jgi:hypothetical protein
MMTHWMSAIRGAGDLQGYYLRSTDCHANKHLFNENIQKHPKLQWYMLCTISPGLGKQDHKWVPQLGVSIRTLREPAKLKDVKEYFTKIYPKANIDDIAEFANSFVADHKKKCYLATTYPNLKQSDIEVLAQMITNEDIKQYEKERGN